MRETDLVQARSDRAWLPRSYISSQMGIGTREFCHVPFVLSNKCVLFLPAAADVVKAFPPFVTFALGWALASQCSITIQFGLGAGDPCYWLARLLLSKKGGAPLTRQPLLSVYPWLTVKETYRYRQTVGVVEAWSIVKAASSFQFFFVFAPLAKKFLDNMLFHSSSKGSWAREEESGRESEWMGTRDWV